jgi:transposase
MFMFYAGIDWADDHHDLAVIDQAGNRQGALRVSHSPAGFKQLEAFLKSFTPDPTQMACILETNHGLLISALLEGGWPVYPVNPKTVGRKRNAAGAKTDAIDAYLLAKTGRSDLADLRRLQPDSPLIEELKALTRDQDRLIAMQTRLVNQLTACLKAYYPAALELFTKLQQATSLHFLQAYPTPVQAAAASQSEIERQLKVAGHTRAAHFAPKIYRTLQQPHLVAPPLTVRTKSRLMLALVEQLLALVGQIAAYDKEIESLFLSHPDSELWASLPGAGKRLAPRLLAEIGEERSRYQRPTNLQAVAGSSPVVYASGNYAKVRRRIAYIKPLGNALYQFAWQSTLQEEWAAHYYRRKRAEGKSHSVAVRALSNNWLRIVHALWRKKECYTSATFAAAQLKYLQRVA